MEIMMQHCNFSLFIHLFISVAGKSILMMDFFVDVKLMKEGIVYVVKR